MPWTSPITSAGPGVHLGVFDGKERQFAWPAPIALAEGDVLELDWRSDQVSNNYGGWTIEVLSGYGVSQAYGSGAAHDLP
jgi:hypothetical protein